MQGTTAAHPGLRHYADRQVRADPTGCAAAALSALRQASDGIVVHFDVDAVDPGDLPLANYPHYGTGVTLDQAAQVLRVAAAAPDVAAVVLTEVNPGHDPDGEQLQRYVTTVGDSLASALPGGSVHVLDVTEVKVGPDPARAGRAPSGDPRTRQRPDPAVSRDTPPPSRVG
jgi:arginase